MLERLEWNEAVRLRSFDPNLVVSDVKLGKRPEQIIAHLTFGAGPCSSSLVRGTVTWAAIAPDTEQLHTQIYLKASLTDDGASRPSGTVGTDLEVGILPSWLDEGY